MATRMLQRRDDSGVWATVNPVLGAGEFGLETDTGIIKLGDGETAWQELPPAFEEPEVKSVFGRVGFVTATASDITDGTDIGREVFTADTQLTARTAIGAGTGNGNVVGTGVLKIVSLSLTEYNALPVKDSTTLYVIPGA